MMKVLSFLFVFAFLAPSASLACSCFIDSLEEHFEQQFGSADAVFVGTAERVERFDDNQTLDISGFERVEFSVYKSWKGPRPGAKFHTWTNTRGCGVTVKGGEHYLIFAFLNAEGRYSLHGCSLTQPLEWAGEVIELLEKANKSLKADAVNGAA